VAGTFRKDFAPSMGENRRPALTPLRRLRKKSRDFSPATRSSGNQEI
jgi:hypothetical protein